jgi:hypothetical protein
MPSITCFPVSAELRKSSLSCCAVIVFASISTLGKFVNTGLQDFSATQAVWLTVVEVRRERVKSALKRQRRPFFQPETKRNRTATRQTLSENAFRVPLAAISDP